MTAAQTPKITSLEPAFRDVVSKRLDELNALTGRTWIVTSGRRSMKEQQRLYDQGRTLPGKKVTNAKPGYSPHNYGLAVDLCPLKGKSCDWSAPRSVWKKMADSARALGYTAGFYFKSLVDMPHIEDPRWKAQQALWLAGKITLP